MTIGIAIGLRCPGSPLGLIANTKGESRMPTKKPVKKAAKKAVKKAAKKPVKKAAKKKSPPPPTGTIGNTRA